MTSEEKIIDLITKINRDIVRTGACHCRNDGRLHKKYNFGHDMRATFNPMVKDTSSTNDKDGNKASQFENNYRRRSVERDCCRGKRFYQGRGFGHGRERLLTVIGEKPGISQSELSRIFDIRPQSLSEIVNKLVLDGFVKKEIDQNDKRATNLYLTSLGENQAEIFRCSHEEFASKSLAELSKDEQSKLIELLEKIKL